MGGRGSWTARDRRTAGGDAGGSGRSGDLRLDDLLDAHFDSEGRLANIGRGARQRLVDRFEPRPPTMGVEDLERAVERLARGLEAMERRRMPSRRAEPDGFGPGHHSAGRAYPGDSWGASSDEQDYGAGDPRFVTYGLDRLESRLDAISRELERRAAGPVARAAGPQPYEAGGYETGAYQTGAYETGAYGAEAGYEAADASRHDWTETGAGFAPQAHEPAADPTASSLDYPQPEDPARDTADSVIDLSRPFDVPDFREPDAYADPGFPADAPEIAPAASIDAVSEDLRRHIEALEARVAHLQERGDDEEIARVREELHRLGSRLEEVDRTGHALSGYLEEATRRIGALEAGLALAQAGAERMEDVRARLVEIEAGLEEARDLAETMGAVTDRVGGLEGGLGEIETIRSRMGAIENRLAATRNLAGNRLGELQDRLAELAERLEDYEASPQVAEALRETHAELMERIDAFEGMARGFVAPDDLDARLAELRHALEALPSQAEISRIESGLLGLADRLDALPAGLAEKDALERIEVHIEALANDLVEMRRRRDAGTADLGNRLGELAERVETLRVEHARIDLDPIDRRFTELSERLDRDRRAAGETMGRFEQRLARIGALLDREEDDGSARLLADVDGKMDALVAAMAAQDPAGVEARFAELGERLASLSGTLSEREDALSARLLSAIDERLAVLSSRVSGSADRAAPAVAARVVDAIGGKLDDLAAAVAAHDPAEIRSGFEALDRSLAELKQAAGRSGGDTAAALKTLDGRLDSLAQAVAAGDASAFRKDFTAIDKALGEIRSAVKSADATGLVRKLDSRLDEIAEAIEANDVAALKRDLAALERGLAEVKAATQKSGSDSSTATIAALGGKIDEVAAAIGAHDPQELRAAIAAIGRRLTDLKGQLDKIAGEDREGAVAGLDRKIDELAARLEARDPAEAIDRRIGAVDERIAPIADRLSAIEEGLQGLAARAPDTRALQSQLDGILHRLELIDSRGFDPDRLLSLVDRLEAQMEASERDDRLDRLEASLGAAPARFAELVRDHAPASAFDEERADRLEAKLEELARAIGASGDWLDPQEMAETRADITALRRELRSLPGLGEGESSLGALMRTVADRLEGLSESAPATARDLDDQVERIAQLLDDPDHGRHALRHVEASLKAIEDRLADLGEGAAARTDFDEEAELSRISAIARSLTGDLEALREAANDSERKTRDSLESVQDTLEAVVKRMAFLERDADDDVRDEAPEAFARPRFDRPEDRAAAAADEDVSAASAPLPLAAAAAHAAATDEAEEGDEDDDARAPRFEYAAFAAPEPAASEAVPPQAAALEAGEAAADQRDAGSVAPQSGLLGRLTSRQLLKRATGGRTDSFSPDPEEGDEPEDQPLEPGTAEPLDSDLSDAPSSDAGSRPRAASAGDAAASDDTSGWRRGSVAADDFLASARRAAQAAAAEAAEAENSRPQRLGLGRLRNLVGRRRTMLAGVLVLAVALAAYEMMDPRRDEAPSGNAVADADAPPALPAEPQLAALAASGTDAAAADPEAATPAAQAADAEADAATVAPAAPAAEPTGAVAEAGTEASGEAPDAESAETRLAALDTGADTAAAPPAPAAATAAPAPAEDLPAAIGPVALVDAARAGDAAAAFEVAARFADGRGVEQDLARAAAWYERAAAAGLAPAEYRLGSVYENGIGAPKDLARAQDYYRRAAEAGNVKAMHNLAVLYAEGAGGDPDLEAAAELFRKAAGFGVRDSQFNIGILHARGIGVPQDMVEAYKWFSIAASTGDEEASRRRDAVAGTMSSAQLAEGKAAAEAFRPEPLDPAANVVPVPENGWGGTGATTSAIGAPDEVQRVQAMLDALGFDPGPVDGRPGEKTRQALAAFQLSAGLPSTGEIDDATISALSGRST